MLSEFKINKIIKECINNFKIKCFKNIHEVKYFHPSGKSLPNGIYYERGYFLNECRKNKNSYIIDESVHDKQYGLAKYRGGIITFSTDINALTLSKNKIINKIRQVVETFKQRLNRASIIHNVINNFNENNEEYIGAYSVGNFFRGKYVGDNGEMYSERSLSIEINGLSSISLFKLAEKLAKEFKQETVLVKDFNKNKIYLVDSKESTTSFDDEMNRINTECD